MSQGVIYILLLYFNPYKYLIAGLLGEYSKIITILTVIYSNTFTLGNILSLLIFSLHLESMLYPFWYMIAQLYSIILIFMLC